MNQTSKCSPNFKDVLHAADRLAGHALKTPLLRSDVIDEACQMQVWFKSECHQKVRAFKYRGAFNRLAQLTARERQSGVVAFSSGNHAQGIARAAKELGLSAIIVMPSDAPAIKVAGVRTDGAEIVFYDRLSESREDIALSIAKRDNRVLVPSFDDPHIIAGQGTVGLEIIEDFKTLGKKLDAIITPIGGGGLCAGIGLAVQHLSPQTLLFAAEPDAYNDHQLSLLCDKRVSHNSTQKTLCDAIMTPRPGEITWPINRERLAGVFTASDIDCLRAMKVAFESMGVKVEPGGVIGLAVLMTQSLPDNIDTVCVVLSGGNVDAEIMQKARQIC